MQSVKFVYFDIGNDLFSFSGGLESLAKLFNKPLDEVKSYWFSKDNDICRGVLKPQVFWNEAKQFFNYKGEDVNFVDFWVKHFSKIQKGHELAIHSQRVTK